MTEILSLDEIEAAKFKAGPCPLESSAIPVNLQRLSAIPTSPAAPPILILRDGWQLADGGEEAQRLKGGWSDAVPAVVPGSVHTALEAAGRLPDQTVGLNQKIAKEESFKTWWHRTSFAHPGGEGPFHLIFEGVAVHCTVWLNGHRLGEHEGMFGGPSFDVTAFIQEENNLVVKVDPAPYKEGPKPMHDFFIDRNVGWTQTAVFNNVYGWHYSDCPAVGIWRDVRIESSGKVRMVEPFVAATDTEGGAGLAVDLVGDQPWKGSLKAVISPENFDGETYTFTRELNSGTETSMAALLAFTLPDPKLWWPLDMGDPNLYRMELVFEAENGGPADVKSFTFGLRTIEMAPLPGGPKPEFYNWTFVVNGKPVFVKGSGWCTMDPLMDFSRERYDRFLTLARDEHCQMLRAWGSGMPETDDFYDLCDRYGIMVMQEWPTAWNSHKFQPYDVLEETVRLNTLRLRNRPSLVMWGGGNESSDPTGPAIDMMGRLSVELDGTRPFHSGEPYGGSKHAYPAYWERKHPDRHLTDEAIFWGEFGLASIPNYESVLRYLPEEEQGIWPPAEDGTYAYHSQVFNKLDCLDRLRQMAAYFVDPDESMERFGVATQLAQVICVRHTLERSRSRWPESTGALLYKLNDNFPAGSWATVDWYGAAKIAHYFVQDAFAPLTGIVLFDSVKNLGEELNLPVYLINEGVLDPDESCQVRIRAVNQDLKEIKSEDFSGSGATEGPSKVGEFSLTCEQTRSAPLFVISDVLRNGVSVHRSFYFVNYEEPQGCIFELPHTTLELSCDGDRATIVNTGSLPAVGVQIERPGYADTFRVSDGYLWMNAGERVSLTVNETDGLTVSALNVDG